MEITTINNKLNKIIYSTICLLLIGFYLSCEATEDESTSPTTYNPLEISFSVVDDNEVTISNTNSVPVDASFLLTFDQSLGAMADYTNYLGGQIKLIDMENSPIDLNIEPIQIANQIKITPTTDLNYGTIYQVIIKKGLIIGNYQVTEDMAYFITTEKNPDNSLIVIYDRKEIPFDGNDITILLVVGANLGSVGFTLEVGKEATLQDGNNVDLSLNENNQYNTNMDFNNGATYNFMVTAQDGNISIYTIRVQLRDSKEISSFVFLKEDNSLLSTNIMVDITALNITKTITNVKGIAHLTPAIIHNGSNISPASGVPQDFSTNNTYTVTAFDGNISSYTVSLTNYYEVIINTNGGLITNAPTTIRYILYGKKTPLPLDLSQEHYGFKGWYDAPDEGNIFNSNTTITTQIIIYAQWTNKQYRVNFDIGGGSTAVTVKSLTPVINKPVYPLKEHYVFDGWYIDDNFTTQYDFGWTVSNDLTLYAEYTNKQYMISFNIDEGNMISPVTVDSLTSVKRPIDSTKEHYVFDGWYLDNALTTQYDFNWVVSNDLALYAEYTNKQYRVKFYQGGGGSLLNTISVTSLTMISALDYPVPITEKIYYKWYRDDGLTQPYNISAQVTNNLNLYAEIISGFQKIIEDEIIPSDLANYGEMSELIFSKYNAGATVAAHYVKETGSGDGSSWANASEDIQAMIDGITDADNNKVYVILVASGIYKPVNSYVMKNHVALVGGFTPGNSGSYDRAGETRLDGNNNKRVFINNNNGLDRTALLYGVAIANGINFDGGGMYNFSSSPTLINVIFSGNEANHGGGMYNDSSSPTLINVTFSSNEANQQGGGMYSSFSSPTSSPTLSNVVFLDNEANHGGGMYNSDFSPTLINVTFSDNEAIQEGGGMYNSSSSPTLIDATFSGNKANNDIGGGMYNWSFSSPVLINVTFSDNEAIQEGGGIYNVSSSPTLINVTFLGNTTDSGGGIYHDGDGQPLTLINTILWNNDNGNIYLYNDTADTETVNLYYSVIEGGTSASTIATGIRLYNGDTNANPISIVSKEVITDNPELGPLANYGGVVNTIFIDSSSPAKDKGVYVRGVKSETGNLYPATNLYYSSDSTIWFSDLDLTILSSPPSDADDLTATDARGYGRVGRPDMGAYEAGGTPP